jgi:hypothetical protein
MSGGRRLRDLRFFRRGEGVEGGFSLRRTSWTDEFGQRYVRLSSSTREHWVPTDADAPIENPAPMRSYAIRVSACERDHARRCASSEPPASCAWCRAGCPSARWAGPIMIYDVSRSTGAEGPWGFLWLMALVSINLGLINLLPIPTLDGGHLLVLHAVEGVIRRPGPAVDPADRVGAGAADPPRLHGPGPEQRPRPARRRPRAAGVPREPLSRSAPLAVRGGFGVLCAACPAISRCRWSPLTHFSRCCA